MKSFAELIDALDQTNKTNEKLALLRDYFTKAPEKDRVWTIALLSHRRPRRMVSTTLLREWAAEKASIPLWLFEESYHIVGDLAETIALVLPLNPSPSTGSLSLWIEKLEEIRDQEETHKKAFVTRAWDSLDQTGRFVFNKIITGGFRIGVSAKLMTRALSASTGIDENILAHRLTGNWDPFHISFEELVLSGNRNDAASQPYPFCLAYALEEGPEAIGDPEQWMAERKWDGIRGQLIVRNGELFLWSRGEELITDKFPEYHELKDALPGGTVLDGEILPWKEDFPLPFRVLQTRIGRKNPGKKSLENAPVIFMAYDLLEWEGKDLRNTPFIRRRQLLETLTGSLTGHRSLLLSPLVSFTSWDELRNERENSLELGCEGIMLKKKDSLYHSGRKKGDWWKWKIDPFTVDAVLTYAMRGHGRRANLYTDYTFSVWKDDELVTFTKAYSGLTDEELRQVDRFVKQNTLERFGPVRSVKAELVFEIAFEGIALSKRHKSGVALRFPRISRWRHDKTIKDINRIEDLMNLIPEKQRS